MFSLGNREKVSSLGIRGKWDKKVKFADNSRQLRSVHMNGLLEWKQCKAYEITQSGNVREMKTISKTLDTEILLFICSSETNDAEE